MSSQYENEIAKRIHRETPSRVRAYRCGYSGSNAMPQPDVLVTDVAANHALELKGPIATDRCRITGGDIEQLLDCGNSYTHVYLVVKFQRREPLVVRYYEKLTERQHPKAAAYNDMSPAKKFTVLIDDCFEPHVTDAGALVVEKPDTDEWPSASAGAADEDAIVSGLGIATAKSTEAA